MSRKEEDDNILTLKHVIFNETSSTILQQYMRKYMVLTYRACIIYSS